MADRDLSATQSDRPPDMANELDGTGLDDPQEVGRGGFGVVYRCRQQALSRNVAVKVLLAKPDLEPESFQRFVREQHAMGALSGHPNIVNILEVGTTRSGLPFLVMPYHSHGSLESRIRGQGRVPVAEAIRDMIKLAGAVETAHRVGILHRDIKPGNVLFTDYDEPQLADFGIARIEGGFETTTSVVTGSPAFTAPEVLRSGGPSVASDVYGLGATLFCMITGHAAYARRSGEQIVAQFLRIAAEPLPDLRADGIPDDVCTVIEASMSHDPSKRPKSAAEFGELLRNIQHAHGQPVQDMTLFASSNNNPIDMQEGGIGTPRSSASSRRFTTPPVPETKFRPAISARTLVDRSRLIDALLADPRPRLTVIHAPAGFGKSTLAAQWAQLQVQDQQVAVAWLNADHDDNNGVWFLAHLLEAIRRVRPTLVPLLGQLLEEQGESAVRYVLTTLINEIHEHHEPVVVIIDDWHRITDTAAADSLRFLLENGCHHLQIIVTSRSTAGLPLATMRVRNELVEIDSTALYFDLQEASSFLVELGGLTLTEEEIAALLDATEGWIAALQLAWLSLRGQPDPATLIARMSGRHHAVAEYLAENVLDTVDPAVLDFLLKTSLPEQICGDLADTLTGERHGQIQLEEVERRHLFLRQVDDDSDWFRYHHLFLQFLRQRLERDHPEQVSPLHRIAAEWFDSHGMLSEAIDHALASDDEDHAVELLEARAMDHVQHAQLATLLGLVEKLPPALIATRARLQIALCWAHGMLRHPAQLHMALQLARIAAKGSASIDPDTDLLTEVDLVDSVGRAIEDRIEDVEHVVAQCLTRIDTLTPWALCAMANLAAFQAVYRYEYDEVRKWHDWATPYHQQISGTFSLMYSHCLVGFAAREQLDISAAERSVQEARQVAMSSGTQSYAARLAGAMLGDLLYDRNRLEEAEQLLDEARELGIDGAPVEFMMATYATSARIKALRGDSKEAAQLLNEGSAAAQALHLPRLAARITNEQVRLGFRLATVGAQTQFDNENGILAMTTELNEDSIIRSLLSRETPSQIAIATARATRLRNSIDTERRPRAALRAQLLLASCLAESGQIEAAKQALIPVTTKCAEIGLIRPLRDEGPQVTLALRAMEHDLREGNWRDEWPVVPLAFLTIVLDD